MPGTPGIVLVAGRTVQLADHDTAGTVDVWLVLPDDLHASAAARRLLAENTGALTDSVRDDLAILVSEVVTNAVVHGRPDVAVHLVVSALLVRVDVYDRGAPVRWRRPPQSASAPNGRGLAIVSSLATRWGTTPATQTLGKSVWFELVLARAA